MTSSRRTRRGLSGGDVHRDVAHQLLEQQLVVPAGSVACMLARSKPTFHSCTRPRDSSKERIRALDFIDANEIVDEFARSIRQELDYRLEARNADAFHKNFAGHPHVSVPRVYWSYTRSRVLTLEYLDGVQLADLESSIGRSTSAGVSPTCRRDVDDDDLPPRVLPRRPASGEHPRPLARADRARRLRPRRQAHRRRHVEADAALHRRGVREHRGAAEAPRRPRRALSEGARGASSSPSCASCTTATTARACRRSTRSR